MKDKKKIIVQISEGLGNQLFMYAHGFSLSKRLNRNIFIDNITGYNRKKNRLRSHQKYLLDHFTLNTPLIKNDFIINNNLFNIPKKIMLLLDNLKQKKSFYLETKYKINKTKQVSKLVKINSIDLANKIYVIGNFENYDYFKENKNELLKLFTLKKKYVDHKNSFIDKLQNSNSVSIHIRRGRFSDQSSSNNIDLIKKSNDFTNNTINYINRAIEYFNKTINNPKFFIWTNDINDINEYTKRLNTNNFTIVTGNNSINDFYLFKFSKHFIVGPSSFHWWGAWLNQCENKICVRPSDINPSNNTNFWPKEWIPI